MTTLSPQSTTSESRFALTRRPVVPMRATGSTRSVDDAVGDRGRETAGQYDRSSFRALYLEHVDAVYGYVLRRTRDPSVAEDLTADTFERALRAIERYEWRGIPFRFWLLRIADRVTTDWYRARARRPSAQLPDDDFLPSSDSAEHEAVRREELVRVDAAIDLLSPAQRLVVVLRLGQGLSHRAIARRLGRGEGAVRMLYQRALRRVRRTLEDAP